MLITQPCLKVSESIYKKFKEIDLLILTLQFIVQDQLQNFHSRGQKIVDINLLGAINCLSPVAKVMQKNKKGHIVFISSPAGYQGLPGAVSMVLQNRSNFSRDFKH